MKSIYDLELHEEINIGSCKTVMKVPGGWNYIYLDEQSGISTCFVPLSEHEKNQIDSDFRDKIVKEVKAMNNLLSSMKTLYATLSPGVKKIKLSGDISRLTRDKDLIYNLLEKYP